VTVFDTAPTGHTLRLLALPGMIDTAIAKLGGLRDRMGGLLSMARGMFAGADGAPNEATLFDQLDALRGEGVGRGGGGGGGAAATAFRPCGPPPPRGGKQRR
jgi:anion-transporting  ArsA/GET3 family ATPase